MDILLRVTARCVLYVQSLNGVSSPFAVKSHQYTLGLTAFDGENNRLARNEKSTAGCTDGHITSTVVGDDYRQFTIGCQ